MEPQIFRSTAGSLRLYEAFRNTSTGKVAYDKDDQGLLRRDLGIASGVDWRLRHVQR